MSFNFYKIKGYKQILKTEKVKSRRVEKLILLVNVCSG